MNPHRTRSKLSAGTNLGEVSKSAWRTYHEIEKKTKRKTYIKSAYFNKEKIFFDFFWVHLKNKGPKERYKRLKYLKAAIELVKYSRKIVHIKKTEVFYRFAGITSDSHLFMVQIKENLRSKRKYLMSCFPIE